MYLNKVEIQGFKSFGNKVGLDIPQGITAIIGPNGSGKSNVADAVRWVLGEQSAKTLRGSKMEDIIFSGTETRRPLGYAEVSLSIQNEDGELAIDFAEVVVKRRIYRSGESEYFLNKSVCRLRDIQELFMDTGVGKEGYSIIGQGQIDKVLSSKPDDRRNLFEEAAGIYKYKIKRAEAQKKLAKEQENIERVNDIIAEIETRLEPLRVEAEKTKRYLAFRDTLRKIDINLFIEETRRLNEELGKIDETRENLDAEYAQQQNLRDELVQREQAIRETLLSLRKQGEEISKNILHLEKLKGHKLADIKVHQEKIKTARALLGQLQKDVDKKAQFRLDMHNEVQLLQTKIVGLELEHTTQQQLLVDEQGKLELFRQSYLSQKLELEQFKQDILGKLRECDVLKVEIERNLSLDDNLACRYDSVRDSVAKLNSDITHQEVALRVIVQDRASLDERLIAANVNYDETVVLRDESEKELADLESECKQIAINKEETERKLKWLRQVKSDYEGYYHSVKQVLKLGQSGVRGIVADIIEVESRYEIAVVTALGSAMQNIVTDTEVDAKNTINIMKQKGISKVTFLPRDTIKPSTLPREYDELSQQPGFLGLGSALVNCQAEYKGIVSYLLGKVVFVDTMDNGSKMAKRFNYKFRIVTLDGETFNVGGALSGGSNKSLANNMFSRSRELRECEENLQLFCSDETVLLEQRDVLFERVNVLNLRCSEFLSIRDSIQAQLLEVVSQEQILLQKLQFCRDNQLQLVNERNKIEDDREFLSSLIDDGRARECELSGEIELVQSSSVSLEQSVVDFERRQDEFMDRITQLKLDVAKTAQAIEFTQQSILSVVKQVEDNDEQAGELLAQYESDEKLNASAIVVIEKEVEELELVLRDSLDNKQSVEDVRVLTENKEAPLKQQLVSIGDRLGNLEKESIRLEGRSEAIVDERLRINQSIWDEYGLTAGACSICEEYFFSIEHMKKLQGDVRVQIRSMGSVNVNAVEDLEQTETRYNFLVTQKMDIINAEKVLMELIETLTGEMNTIFSEQFKHISENFSEIFKELFGGGSAFLQLTDEENVLESGIDIIVKPPGKKLQNMTLLSGGERALTAIALLFGILKLKPSPFCVLDEIDAALDDANVIRFVKYLKGLALYTQFVVITHRKGTMENADTLYGVTQQEQGVSTVLAINYDDANKYLEK